MPRALDGAVPSPNIWRFPAVYEVENRAVDPDGVIESFMDDVHGLKDAAVLDIGCGSGFHLPRFAARSAHVWGVEPHHGLAALARKRCRALENVTVLSGSAQRLPVPTASIDVAHARWAYFFGPGCEPGLAELDRVMRRGGAAFVIDNDPTTSTFGRWFRRSHPMYDVRAVDAFFSRHGWSAEHREIRWEFGTRADFEAVVRIEFAPEHAEVILAEHAGCQVDYAITLRVRHF